MKTVVIDASVAGAWMLPDEANPQSDALLRDIAGGKVAARVPMLWWYECANLARSAVLRHRLDAADARLAMAALRRLPITVAPWGADAAQEVLDLALTLQLSAYDAAYVHAAQAESCELYTTDRDLLRLAKRLPGIQAVHDYPMVP